MDSPTSSYEKTQPLEACMSIQCCTFFQGSLGSNVLFLFLLASSGAGNLKARFENMAKASEVENKKRAEEEKARRQARESREREQAKRRQEVRAVCTPRGRNYQILTCEFFFYCCPLQEERCKEEEPPQAAADEEPEYDMPPDIPQHVPEIRESLEPEVRPSVRQATVA